MSNEAMNWAFAQTGVKGGTKFVLVALADKADEEHSCYPAVATLARLTGLADKTVRRSLDQLVEAGLVREQERHRENGSRTSSRYYLAVAGPFDGPPADEGEIPRAGTQNVQGAWTFPVRGAGTQNVQGIEPSVEEPTDEPTNTKRAPGREIALSEPSFDDFWAAYPRRHGRAAAEKAWAKAVKRATPGTIVSAAAALAADPNLPEQAFIAHASTWLNQDRWTDPPLPPRPERANRGNVVETGRAVDQELQRREAGQWTHDRRTSSSPALDS